jgi:DNA repair exonuclease SbcCD ATPase subunit
MNTSSKDVIIRLLCVLSAVAIFTIASIVYAYVYISNARENASAEIEKLVTAQNEADEVLRTALETASGDILNAEEKLKKTKEELGKAKENLEQVVGIITKERDEAVAENEKLRTENNELKKQIAIEGDPAPVPPETEKELRKAIDRLIEEVKKLQVKNNNSDEELKTAQKNLADCKADYAKYVEEIRKWVTYKDSSTPQAKGCKGPGKF